MADAKPLNDPQNRVVCVIDKHEDAVKATVALIDSGFAEDHIRLLHGEDAASKIDTSAKWFADTDEELKRFERELEAGHCVLSVPIEKRDDRERVHAIVTEHNARHITHFGLWITEVMRS